MSVVRIREWAPFLILYIRGADLKKILLTGATGYVGGRLLKGLQKRDEHIRLLVRRPEYIRNQVNSPQVELVKADLFDKESLQKALEGIDTAYYLVHCMGQKNKFFDAEIETAKNFASICMHCGVKRIIYLGGLGDEKTKLSPHLKSRHKVGEVLCSSGVQVIEFRASIIIGAGSLSFEMIRALVQKLPIMVTPKWVFTKAQPIYIEDVLCYLMEALDLASNKNHIFEIGGKDQVSYGELMHEYARQRGIKRWMIPIPFLTPYLSSLWLGLVTPLYARVGRKLLDSLKNPTIVQDLSAGNYFSFGPIGIKEAIALSLQEEDKEMIETHWAQSLSSSGQVKSWVGTKFHNRIVESFNIEISNSPQKIFSVIESIGGENGWYAFNWLWKIRSIIDVLLGGIGMKRGRLHPRKLKVGDPLDWWRVEKIDRPNELLLFAEMKLPGRAWLKFELSPLENSNTLLTQTSLFDPRGFGGLFYWYILYPFHWLIFRKLLQEIGKKSSI